MTTPTTPDKSAPEKGSKNELQEEARLAGKTYLSGLDDQSQFYFATGYLLALIKYKEMSDEIRKSN